MRRGVLLGFPAATAVAIVLLWPTGTADDDAAPGETSTTTTTATTSTTTTEGTLDPCTMAIPSDAGHLTANRTPLDVDQDGRPDEFLVSEIDGGHRIHVDLGEVTPWVDVPGDDRPRLLDRPDGGAAGRDLDGDGWLEFFLAPLSTDAATVVRLDDCGASRHEVLPHEGEWCIRDGGFHCDRRLACVGDAVISDMTSGGDVEGLEAGEWVWARWENRLVDGEIVATRAAATHYSLADPPPGVPTAADDGTVDCSPDADASLATVAAPGHCAGTGDRPADATLVAELDIDGDDTIDRVIGWEAASGAPDGWLLVELGHGVTPPTAIPYNWAGGPEFLAAADVDGDAVLEVFFMAPSNTAHNAFAVQVVDCIVRVVDYAEDPSNEPSQRGYLLHGIGGNSCAPTGCAARVTCTATGVITEHTGPNDHRNEQFDPDDPEMLWWRAEYALEDGAWQTVEASTTTYRLADAPADSPLVLGGGLHC